MGKKEAGKSTSDQKVLQSLEVRPIQGEERAQWDELVRHHHYLGLHSLIGETIRYVALHHEQWLALIGWSAAAFKCKVRDQWIGWPSFLKEKHLAFVANNSRFLILPSLTIPNLASRVLALNLKRLSDDWQTLYGHPLYLAETFVDPRHFKGICYKAAGWSFLGYTSGFAKCATHYYHHGNPKMVFVRLLHPEGKRMLREPSIENSSLKEVKPMQLSLKHAESLKEHLAAIPDPRFRRGIRHRKLSVVTTALCALICGAHTFTAMAQWAKSCTQSMLKRLGCRLNPKTHRYEAPSEPTLRRLLQKIDADAVDQAFSDWLCSLTGEDVAIAIDGKTLKGARQENGTQVHLLSAFLHQKGVVIAQREVKCSTNEIPVARQLLESLNIQGSVATLDALHTQKDTADFLVKEKGADYLFTVKDNQRTLKQHIEDLSMVSFPPSPPND